jgi:predicted  nucleic acid-binding Zn-ribbon protein
MVSDCPNCGKRTFILQQETRNGRKGYMGKCYNCGFEKWIDQGRQSDNTDDNPWRVDVNPKWWF